MFGGSVRIMPKPISKYNDSIVVAQSLFNKCYFNILTCTDGLESLRLYESERDKDNNPTGRAKHNQYSHGADSFQAMMVGLSIYNPSSQYSASITKAGDYDEFSL